MASGEKHNSTREGSMAIDQAQPGPGDSTGEVEGVGKAQEVASQAIDKAQEKAQDLKGQASARARSELDARSTQLAEQVTSVVQALREAGEKLRRDGNEAGGKAVQAVADRAERLGGYLRDSSTDRFAGDLESFGRRKPWMVAGLGVAAGFMVSRFLKASAENRSSARQEWRGDGDAARPTGGGRP
jgi:hypothetical protein